MSNIISDIDIKPGYRTDHSLVCMLLLLNKFERGRGVWKFNSTKLTKEYLSLVKTCINDEKKKYCPIVYNMDNLDVIPDDDMQLNIDFDTYLVLILITIWRETIK